MENKILQIIKSVIDDESVSSIIDLDTDLINEVKLTSLNITDVIIKIEDEFDIDFNYSQLDDTTFSSISNFCSFLKENYTIKL